jgi:hypothetical protein
MEQAKYTSLIRTESVVDNACAETGSSKSSANKDKFIAAGK